MNPRVIDVSVKGSDLFIRFANGQRRRFTVTPYLGYPVFEKLRDPAFLALARPQDGTVTWPDGTDFCPDTLYLESVEAD